MKRVKMPLTFRMQNFFIEDMFWTSASKTIWQKIKRWKNKETGRVCNTSKGYTLPHHGQMIKKEDGLLICQERDHDYLYRYDTGEFIGKSKSTLPDIREIRKLKPGIALQGVSENLAVFGWPNTSTIDVFDIKTKTLKFSLDYKKYKKWYWLNWEAEGIQKYDNSVFIGISVKTIFGVKLNYIEKL